jgi:indolepyruvate ferredoxin oxidoreductase beta subunit
MVKTKCIGGVTNVLCVGIGGQGVLTVSEVLAQAAFLAGYDVKKNEVHGMSQRGGSVTSAVRFGARVHAPLVSAGEVDVLIGFEPNETRRSRHLVRPKSAVGVTGTPAGVVVESIDALDPILPHPRTRNIAVLGLASRHLPIAEEHWLAAIAECVPAGSAAINQEAFLKARALRTD